MTMQLNPRNALPSPTQAHFAQVPKADIERSKFDRSSTVRMTFDADYLVPFYVDEVLPGDTFNMRAHFLARTQPLISPLMDNLYADIFWFYTPNRLNSTKWQGIMGEQPTPTTDVSGWALTPMVFTAKAITQNSLHHYIGMRQSASVTKEISPLHHLSYNLAWNEWFRDQNLNDPVYHDAAKATFYDPDDFVLLRRNKRHDYFTSCLPWPQKGPDVLLPLGSTAPVIGIGKTATTGYSLSGNMYETGTTGATAYTAGADFTAGNWRIVEDAANPGHPAIFADLSDASALSINEARLLWQTQRMYERDARGGTRYKEILLSHFGVTAPDDRLQRPELLGMSSIKINVRPLPQMSAAETNKPLGFLASTVDFEGAAGFSKSFVEHGTLMGLIAVRADLTYQQGLHRMFNRFSRLDFALPVFAHLGEQEVLNQEIFVQGDATTNVDGIVDYQAFGFQERYAEYRYLPARIMGEFNSDYAQALPWTLSQDFDNLPGLNDEFIESDTPMSRVLSVTNQAAFKMDVDLHLICARPLPVYSVPGFVDHF